MYSAAEGTWTGLKKLLERFIKMAKGPDCSVSIKLVTFDDKIECPDIPEDPTEMIDSDYESLRSAILPRNMTSLYDAMGFAITKHRERYNAFVKGLSRELRDIVEIEQFIFVLTDGIENSSQKYTHEMIKTFVKEDQANGVKYIFAGANINAEKTGGDFGIPTSACLQYTTSRRHSNHTFRSIGSLMERQCSYNTQGNISFTNMEREIALSKSEHTQYGVNQAYQNTNVAIEEENSDSEEQDNVQFSLRSLPVFPPPMKPSMKRRWPTREERKKAALANSTKDMCWACGYEGCGICGKEKESTLGDFCTINEPLKRMCRKEP
jgi:hypothetical protein